MVLFNNDVLVVKQTPQNGCCQPRSVSLKGIPDASYLSEMFYKISKWD